MPAMRSGDVELGSEVSWCVPLRWTPFVVGASADILDETVWLLKKNAVDVMV